jgi:hypothetical protein
MLGAALGVHSNKTIALGIAIFLVILTVPIARRVAARERDPQLYRILMAAVVVHLLMSEVNLWVVVHLYHGVTDTTRYVDQGAILARRFRTFNFSLAGVRPPIDVLNQGSVSIACGVIMAIIGINKLGLFVVFSWLAFLATVAFYRAFSLTFPEGNRRRYAYMVFFLPSLLYWTADASKETMMYLSLGLCALGAASVLAHKRGGAPLLVVGTIIGIYVRPQELLLFMVAFAVAGLFRRRNAQKSLRGLRRILVMALQAALLLAAVSLSQQLAKKAPVFNLTQLAKNNVGQPSSLNYHPGPAYYLRDVYTVLFDPTFNAHGSAQRLAAFENIVIIILILTSLRRLRRLPRASFVRPYVLMCVLYTIAFPYAFAALNNLGLIDRERVLLLPFFLVLLAIPVSPRGRPRLYPWEYSVAKKKRKERKTRWGAAPPPTRDARLPAGARRR